MPAPDTGAGYVLLIAVAVAVAVAALIIRENSKHKYVLLHPDGG